MRLILRIFYSILFFQYSQNTHSRELQLAQLMPRKQTEQLNTSQRPQYLRSEIESTFDAVSKHIQTTEFNYYGSPDYSLVGIDQERMIHHIAQRAIGDHPIETEFYILDIGAGDGSFGKRIFQYVNSPKFEDFKKNKNIKTIKFHIVSVTGEYFGSTIQVGTNGNHYYISQFPVENLTDGFIKLDPLKFKFVDNEPRISAAEQVEPILKIENFKTEEVNSARKSQGLKVLSDEDILWEVRASLLGVSGICRRADVGLSVYDALFRLTQTYLNDNPIVRTFINNIDQNSERSLSHVYKKLDNLLKRENIKEEYKDENLEELFSNIKEEFERCCESSAYEREDFYCYDLEEIVATYFDLSKPNVHGFLNELRNKKDVLNTYPLIHKIQNIQDKIDWIVSRYCFIHLIDPVGTFKEAFDHLRPGQGALTMDGFPIHTKNSATYGGELYINLANMLIKTGQPFLMRGMQDLPAFLIMRKNSDRLVLPLQYKGTVSSVLRDTAKKDIASYTWLEPITDNVHIVQESDKSTLFGDDSDVYKKYRDVFYDNVTNWSSIYKYTSERPLVSIREYSDLADEFFYIEKDKAEYDMDESRRRFIQGLPCGFSDHAKRESFKKRYAAAMNHNQPDQQREVLQEILRDTSDMYDQRLIEISEDIELAKNEVKNILVELKILNFDNCGVAFGSVSPSAVSVPCEMQAEILKILESLGDKRNEFSEILKNVQQYLGVSEYEVKELKNLYRGYFVACKEIYKIKHKKESIEKEIQERLDLTYHAETLDDEFGLA
jgi:hypothetical protein